MTAKVKWASRKARPLPLIADIQDGVKFARKCP